MPSKPPTTFFCSWLVLIGGFKIWLISDLDIQGKTQAMHDDRLFVVQAYAILNGQWLGDYNELTLIKGPAYPMWLALLNYFQLPLIQTQALFYIFACALLAFAVNNYLKKPYFAILCFTVLALNIEAITRIVRMNLYTPLVLCCFGLLLMLFGTIKHKLSFLCSACTLGLVISAFWLTREEGVWLIPALALGLGFILYTICRSEDINRSEKIIKSLIIAVPILIPLGSINILKTINYFHYRSFNTSEIQSSDFKAFYGSLTRVRQNNPKHLVPINKQGLSRLYQISPTFNQLKPFMQTNKAWVNASCNEYPHLCGEIAGGWLIWAIRDAMAKAGYFENGSKAESFYQQVQAEITNACQSQEITCLAQRNTLMPRLTQYAYFAIYDSFQKALLSIFRPDYLNPDYLAQFWFKTCSEGDLSGIQLFQSLSNNKLVPLTGLDQCEVYYQNHVETLQFKVITLVTEIYNRAWPVAFMIAIAAYLIRLILLALDKRIDFFFVFYSAILLAVVSRLCLLILIDATSFPAINTLYLYPVYPLLLSFMLMSIWDTANQLKLMQRLNQLIKPAPPSP